VHVQLLSAQDAPVDAAPYYLIAGRTLTKDVRKGQTITIDMLDLDGSELERMYREGKNA
jgi:predicted homoserine dehydrogenase-like protein